MYLQFRNEISKRLNIVTWNVENDLNSFKSNMSAKEKTAIQSNLIVNMVEENDVVLLQEVSPNLYNMIENESLSMKKNWKVYFMTTKPESRGRSGLCTAVNLLRCNMKKVGYINVIQNLKVEVKKTKRAIEFPDFDSSYWRSDVSLLKTTVEKEGFKVTIYNTHFPFGRFTNQIAGEYVNCIMSKHEGDNIILAGDFNHRKNDEVIQYMSGEKTNLFSKGKCFDVYAPERSTCIDNKGFNAPIDYLMVSNNQNFQKVEISPVEAPTYSRECPSDHLPVHIKIDFKC